MVKLKGVYFYVLQKYLEHFWLVVYFQVCKSYLILFNKYEFAFFIYTYLVKMNYNCMYVLKKINSQ